jgi:Holliday junction resolvase RusA-like endonuclease
MGAVGTRAEVSVNCRLVVIPGKPVPFARPRPHFKKPGVFIHPKNYRDWLKDAKHWIDMTVNEPPLTGPVACEVVALFPRPKSWPKRIARILHWRDGYPDLDNLIKAGLDAGNELLYTDDRLVVRLSGTKLYSRDQECGLAIHVAPAPMISLPWGVSFRPCQCWDRVCFMDRGGGAEPRPNKSNE